MSANLVNLVTARRTLSSDTPSCRAISVSVNLLVDVNPSVQETASKESASLAVLKF
jgi:hypothetical protein